VFNKRAGYEVEGKIVNHFYMDALKLFSKDETELQQELTCQNIQQRHENGVWPRQMLLGSFQA
jgi:hypothetical protein